MRTIKISVFSFDELSDKAKEEARQEVRCTQAYFWADEAINSLKQMALHFGAVLSDYDIDFSNSVQHGGARFTDNDFIEEDGFDEIVTDAMHQEEIDALRITTQPGRLEDLTLEYNGMQRTTTGVIRLMRDDGKEVVASLLEEMRETCQEMQRSLDGLKRLHKRRTGHYPVITKREPPSE